MPVDSIQDAYPGFFNLSKLNLERMEFGLVLTFGGKDFPWFFLM